MIPSAFPVPQEKRTPFLIELHETINEAREKYIRWDPEEPGAMDKLRERFMKVWTKHKKPLTADEKDEIETIIEHLERKRLAFLDQKQEIERLRTEEEEPVCPQIEEEDVCPTIED